MKPAAFARRIAQTLAAAASLAVACAAQAAPFAYVPSPDSKLTVVDTATNHVVATLPTGANPNGVAVTPAGHRVYVSNFDDGTVTVIDAGNLRVLTTIPVGAHPLGLQVSPDGHSVAVATFGPNGAPLRTISVIDVASGSVTPIAVGLGPTSVAYNSSGSALYVSNFGDNTISVIDTGSLQTLATLNAPANPFALITNPSGTRVYVMHITNAAGAKSQVSVLDTFSNQVIATIPLAGDPQFLAVNPQGTRLYAAIGSTGSVSVIDTSNNAKLLDFLTGTNSFPAGVAVSPDGSRVLVVDARLSQLNTFDASNFALVASAPVGASASAFGDFLGPQNPTNGADSPGALSGIWFNPNESGWGVNFTQRGSNVFAAWYTYDNAGNPKWYVAPNCSMPAANSCSGTLYQVTGPVFFGVQFDPSKRNVTAVGSVSVSFANNDSGTFSYTVSGQSRSVQIQRQVFGQGAVPTVNYTDLWFNPDEPGWGIAITQRGSTMFAAWYVYDANGNPTWVVVPNCAVGSTGDSCAGDAFTTKGPPFGPTFDPAQVQVFAAGRMILNFTDPNHGEISYLFQSLFVTKKITRELF
ncbi:MAG: cytochrome D1 domain-containing protein [Usitatibacter sp.]